MKHFTLTTYSLFLGQHDVGYRAGTFGLQRSTHRGVACALGRGSRHGLLRSTDVGVIAVLGRGRRRDARLRSGGHRRCDRGCSRCRVGGRAHGVRCGRAPHQLPALTTLQESGAHLVLTLQDKRCFGRLTRKIPAL